MSKDEFTQRREDYRLGKAVRGIFESAERLGVSNVVLDVEVGLVKGWRFRLTKVKDDGSPIRIATAVGFEMHEAAERANEILLRRIKAMKNLMVENG